MPLIEQLLDELEDFYSHLSRSLLEELYINNTDLFPTWIWDLHCIDPCALIMCFTSAVSTFLHLSLIWI